MIEENKISRDEIEKKILGMLVAEPDLMTEINDKINLTDFENKRHRNLFSALLTLYNSNGTYDEILILKQLTKMGVVNEFGGRETLTDLIENAGLSVSFSDYLEILKDKSMQQKVLSVSREINELASSSEKLGARALLDSVQKK